MSFSLYSVGRCIGAAALGVGLAASCLFAQAVPQPSPTSHLPQKLLPARFSGWVETSGSKAGTAPEELDHANADVLTEYGLKDFSESTYRHGSSQMTLRAMHFADATGAYGAYTFYRKPGMKPMAIANNGAGDPHEIIFRSGATVIDAKFDSPVASEQSALNALAANLLPAPGSGGVAPSLPQYLPSSGLDTSTVRYAFGPVAYTRMAGVLPSALIDFSRDAEAVTADYSFGAGKETLTILEYPTPQMAIERLKAIGAMLKGPLPPALQQGNPAALGVKQSGPLIVVSSGDLSSEQAHRLLDEVKYQAEVTWNRPGNSTNEVRNAAKMLLGIAYLTAFLAACSFLLAIFLGGGRAVWRVLQGKPSSTVYEEDFISLNLSDWQSGPFKKLQ